MSMMTGIQNAMRRVAIQNNGLQTRMEALTAGGKAVGQEEMLAMQFEIGQYNAMMEAVSSIAKGMTDMLKTLAQRTN